MLNAHTNQTHNPSEPPHRPNATEPIPFNPWAYLYSLGFSLIPLAAGGKKPLVKWTEYQTTKPDWSHIEQWQIEYPDANIGIVTGIVSGIFVVDFDSPEWRRTNSATIRQTCEHFNISKATVTRYCSNAPVTEDQSKPSSPYQLP